MNGIREYAKSKGATYSYSPLNYEDLTFDEQSLSDNLRAFEKRKNKLFAYPAQSNVSGVKHSLKWIKTAQGNGWDVLLDASAFVPTNVLDLKSVKPDFVSISFYKMFGYPTGLGCLLIRKDKFGKLQKPWFAGGTVTLASAMTDNFILAEDHSKFEDGTLNYLDIPALKIGIEHIQQIGIDTINKRVTLLTSWLFDQLKSLRHCNGSPMIKILGPSDAKNHGATIIFNFLEQNGEVHPYMDVESRAKEMTISIRTGCFCNPGIDEINSQLKSCELRDYFQLEGNHSIEEMISYLNKMRGAVRVSLGLVSNLKDLYQFLQFVKSFRDN